MLNKTRFKQLAGLKEAFQPGQKYASNFDYDGMIDYMKNIDVQTADVAELEKVEDSATDVNYHTEASALSDIIDALKRGDKAGAEEGHKRLITILEK